MAELPKREQQRTEAEAMRAEPSPENTSSTVGTGSVIGLGCLAAVVVLVVLAIAFRLLGGSW